MSSILKVQTMTIGAITCGVYRAMFDRRDTDLRQKLFCRRVVVGEYRQMPMREYVCEGEYEGGA